MAIRSFLSPWPRAAGQVLGPARKRAPTEACEGPETPQGFEAWVPESRRSNQFCPGVRGRRGFGFRTTNTWRLSLPRSKWYDGRGHGNIQGELLTAVSGWSQARKVGVSFTGYMSTVAPGIGLYVTPKDPTAVSRGWEYHLRRIGGVVDREHLAVAINGTLFTSKSGWPQLSGDLANGVETVVADHVVSHVCKIINFM